MNNNIFSSMMWRFGERIGAQLVTFVVSIVLARIISPSDYGIVTLVLVFTSILQVFVDSGLGNALIQKKDVDNIDYSTVFFVNLVFCLILYWILFLVSPIISSFYADPSMSLYIRVLGLTIVISGLKNIQQAYVSRNMLFRKFFFSTIGGTIISAIVGVTMAYAGFGVWALISQQLANVLIDTLILWVTVPWRPNLVFSFVRLRCLFNYGWRLLGSALIDAAYLNLSSLVIGKIYSTSDLSYYNQGDKFPKLLVTNINTSIDSVLFPALSIEQDNKKRMKEITKRMIKISTYIMTPLMIGMAVCSKSLVALLLTEKWIPCVRFIQAFCLMYMLYPLHTANLNAIKALGRSDLCLRMEFKKKAIGMLILFVTMNISVEIMALGMVINSVIGLIINISPNRKLLDYGYKEQLLDILPAILLAVFMGIVVYPIQLLGYSYFVTLLMQCFVGFVVYVLGSIIFHIDSFEYLINIAKPYFYKLTKIKRRSDKK